MNAAFHILVADDDEDDRLIISEALRGFSPGIQISEVNNGQQLVDLLKEQRTSNIRSHAIILDINMPYMDGAEALQKLHEDDLLQGTPVYILSTMRNKKRVEEAIALGAVSAFTKPSTMEQFQEIINEILNNSFFAD